LLAILGFKIGQARQIPRIIKQDSGENNSQPDRAEKSPFENEFERFHV
jgi:hypothetical protein